MLNISSLGVPWLNLYGGQWASCLVPIVVPKKFGKLLFGFMLFYRGEIVFIWLEWLRFAGVFGRFEIE
jgi:hypothetical protein